MGKLKVLKEAELRSKYRGSSVNAATDEKNNAVRLRIPTRLLWHNAQIGGGNPYGKVMEIFGYESTGKTLLALDYAYGCQQLGGVVLFADAERAFDNKWAELNGLDLSQLELFNYNGFELFSDWVKDTALYYRSILKNNEPILVIYDSIAAAETEDNVGSDQANQKGTFGMNRAKLFNEFYRKRIDFFAKYGITVIMLNQVREKIGATMYESAISTPGGGATKFFASIRVSLTRSSQIKGRYNKVKGIWVEDKLKGKKIGQNVFVGIPKNKTYPPGENIKTQVYFKPDRYNYPGYNRYLGLDDILVDRGILKIKKDGNANAYFLDGVPIVRKLDTFSDELHNDTKLRKKLLAASGVNTISKTRDILANLKTNLYPVKIKADVE